MKPSVDQLVQKMQEYLKNAEENTKNILAPFAKLKIQENQACACIELFEYNNYHLNYNKYFVRQADGRNIVDCDFASAFGDNVGSALPELANFTANTFNTYEYSSEESEYFAPLERKILFDHFKKCWLDVGGMDCEVPTYFSFEKNYTFTDFMTGEVHEENDMIKKLGFNI